MEFIDLKQQYNRYKDEIDRRIRSVLDKGHYIMGEEVFELEKELAAYTGSKHAIAVSSGTCSLFIALLAMDVQPDDEIITVPFTWIASSEVISLTHAKPVFVDIEPDYYNINVSLIEKAITKKTKGILAVNLFGQMADYEALNDLAKKHNLFVIEDAAQSFGSTQNGIHSCKKTLFGSTSFFPAKPLGCYGDGGALFTDDDKLASKCRAIRTHGGEMRHHHPYLGLNGRLDTLQAAILLAKLPHFNQEIEARQKHAEYYNELLNGIVETPEVMESNTHVYAQYTIRVMERELLINALKKEGIPSAVYYPKCLHEQPVFANLGYKLGDFPEAEKASKQVLSLPMHPWLKKEEQELIAEIIKTHASHYPIEALQCC